jgi:hypothetical protein
LIAPEECSHVDVRVPLPSVEKVVHTWNAVSLRVVELHVDEVEQQWSAGDDSSAAREEVSSDDALDDRALASTLKEIASAGPHKLGKSTTHLRSNDDDLRQLHFGLATTDRREDVLQLADDWYERFHPPAGSGGSLHPLTLHGH